MSSLIYEASGERWGGRSLRCRFRDGISFDDKNDTMHRIFLCLDAVEDWQFSLFDYDEVEKLRPENIPGSLFYAGERYEKVR